MKILITWLGKETFLLICLSAFSSLRWHHMKSSNRDVYLSSSFGMDSHRQAWRARELTGNVIISFNSMRNHFEFKRPFISIKHAQWLHRKNLWINSTLRYDEILLPSRVEMSSLPIPELFCGFCTTEILRFLLGSADLNRLFLFLVRISCVCDFWLGKLIRQAHLFQHCAHCSWIQCWLFWFCCLLFSVLPSLPGHRNYSSCWQNLLLRKNLSLLRVVTAQRRIQGTFLCLLTWMKRKKSYLLSFPACCFFWFRCPQIYEKYFYIHSHPTMCGDTTK